MAKKMRSPNYPAIGLGKAVEFTRNLWNKEKRTPVPDELAVRAAFGYKGLSGPARANLSALKKYGLVEELNEGWRVSELGMQILHSPSDSEDYRRAIVEAARKPELFQELAATYLEASDDSLRSFLIVRKGFSEGGASQVIDAFRDTFSIAKLSEPPYNQPVTAQGETIMPETGTMNFVSKSPELLNKGAIPITKTISCVLSREITAEVRFMGGEVKPSHLEMLRKHLELTKMAMEGDEN
jgi:hypothetical protein